VWKAGSSRVQRLRSLGLFFLRPGVLRKSAVRILLLLSRNSLMPEKFCTSRAPTRSRCFSPNASPPSCVIVGFEKKCEPHARSAGVFSKTPNCR